MALDCRNAAVAWALYDVAHKSIDGALVFHYSEGSDRMDWATKTPLARPWFGDCSSHDTFCVWCAGGKDINGLPYSEQAGYTGTILSHNEHIALYVKTMRRVKGVVGLVPFTRLLVRPGDLVVYGAGTGVHTAFVVKRGLNPLTVSMGQEGDPSLVYVYPTGKGVFDGRSPVTYVRPDYGLRPGVTAPVYPPGMAPAPPQRPPAPFKELRQGSAGKRVWMVQQQLRAKWGQRVLPVGIYTKSTRLAVGTIQRRLGLPENGIVDAATWKAIGL